MTESLSANVSRAVVTLVVVRGGCSVRGVAPALEFGSPLGLLSAACWRQWLPREAAIYIVCVVDVVTMNVQGRRRKVTHYEAVRGFVLRCVIFLHATCHGRSPVSFVEGTPRLMFVGLFISVDGSSGYLPSCGKDNFGLEVAAFRECESVPLRQLSLI